MAKIEIFPLCIGYSCTTLRVKNSLKIGLSLTIFEIFTLFHFPLKSKMAAKSGKNWNFSPSQRTLLYYPVGQKFAQNHSISYEKFSMFYFPLKSKMAAKSGENWNFYPLHRILLYYPVGQNSLEITLSLTVFKIFTLFHFPLKSKMAAKSGENWNFSPTHTILLYYPVGQKFPRNRSISYGFRDIHTFSFSAKIQDGHQKWRKLNFFPFA